MTFFRIKKIKGKEYAYIVKNEWQRKGSRQRVKGYLGKAYRLKLENNIEFLRFASAENLAEYTNKNDFRKILKDLIEWELFRFGTGKHQFSIDLDNKKIENKKKGIVLLINDGFVCHLTLKNLLDFRAEGDEEQDGYRLARAFVEAGIKVPKDVFVALFGKLYK